MVPEIQRIKPIYIYLGKLKVYCFAEVIFALRVINPIDLKNSS